MMRQSHFRQGAGKTEAVQETEAEGDEQRVRRDEAVRPEPVN
jgi:hypothetical protein